MNRTKWMITIAITIVVLIVLIPTGWFIYTRFCLPHYAISIDWSTITYQNETYRPQNITYETDGQVQAALEDMNSRIGKTIGIGVFPKRSLTDLIWPVWVMDYDGDKEHRQIFVRGLMDTGNVYEKTP